MKEIDIREETEKFLFNYFKKFEGKYIYFMYSIFKEELMRIFFIKEVGLRNGKAKAKVCYYDKEKDEISKGRWNLIRTLKDKWIVIDNKKELKKLLILENLK